MLNRPRSVSLSSDVTFSNPSSILAALHWTCSRMSTSFFLIGSPSADTVVQMWFYQCPKGEGSFPRTYQLCLCYHHPGRCWPPPQEGAAKSWVTHGPPEPSGPSLQSCSLQLSPSLYWCMKCIPAQRKFSSAFTEFQVPDNSLFQLTGSSAHQPCPRVYWLLPSICHQLGPPVFALCPIIQAFNKFSSIGVNTNH